MERFTLSLSSLTGIIGFSILLLSLVLINRYWRLRHIKGPFLASLTGLWRLRLQYSGSIDPVLYQLHKKYGPIVRIGPNTVSVSEPDHLRTVFGARGGFTKVRTLFSILTHPSIIITKHKGRLLIAVYTSLSHAVSLPIP